MKSRAKKLIALRKFPAYMERLVTSDLDNQSVLTVDGVDGSFEAATFAPAAKKKSFR
jgi:hypothetical protein